MGSITREGNGRRRVISSYDSYAEAQAAVDRLADEGFPVERVSILAEGLKFEERVTGRKGYGRRLGGTGCRRVAWRFHLFRLRAV